MSQPIIQGFITTADLDGIKKMSAGQKSLRADMAQMEVQAARSSAGFDAAFKKLERPLGKEVFRTLALQATGAASSMNSIQSAGQAASMGLQIAGQAAVGMAGPLGIAVLAVVALVTVFSKLRDANKLTVESIAQSVDKLKQQSDGYKQAADNLQKLNLITDKEAATLRNSATATKAEIEAIRTKVRESIKGAELRIQELKGLEEHRRKLGLLTTHLKQVKEAEAGYANSVKLTAGFLNNSNATLEERRKKSDMLAEALGLETATMIAAMGQAGNYNGLLSEQARLKTDLALAEEVLIDALRRGDEKAVESAKIRIESIQAQASATQAAITPMKAQIQSISAEIVKFANISASAWQYQNDRLVFSTEKAGAELIKATGDYLTKIIAMEAAVAFASGNIGKGIALTAAAGVVATIAGAASTYLEHEGSRGSDTNSPSGGGRASSSSQGGGGDMMNLRVVIEGGYFDDKAADNLAKRLSERVQRGNVRLVSSTVNPSFGMTP